MAAEVKYKMLLAVWNLRLKERHEDIDDVNNAYELLDQLMERLEKVKNDTIEYMVEQGKELEYIKDWTRTQKGFLALFRNVQWRVKKQMEKSVTRRLKKLNRELYIQQQVNEEQIKFQHQQQKEKEEAALRQQQREQEWYMQKVDMGAKYRRPIPE